MTAILSAIVADPNVAPQHFTAAAGWRRVFLSAIDARAYERGYSCWPAPMPADMALFTPFSCGWFDAEADERFRVEDRRAEHIDRKEDDE